MKIITWNCNMAFRKKGDNILALKPDILVVPECEHPEKLLFSPNTPKPYDILWFGNNQNKGLCIFSFNKFRLKVHENHNQDLKMIIPISVTNDDFEFNLFAIWANNPTDKEGQYIEQVWKAIRHYDELFLNNNAILIGDFNSNKIWDNLHGEMNHSRVVKLLESKGIFSAYHSYFKEEQGSETSPTFYMYRHKEKVYHIDYCFLSKDFTMQLKSVEVGDFEFWTKYSDHVPLIINI